MNPKCIACGMPMMQPAEFAAGDVTKNYCRHCCRPDGSMKSRHEVLEGMSAFIVRTQGIDLSAARRVAEDAMSKLPAWRQT